MMKRSQRARRGGRLGGRMGRRIGAQLTESAMIPPAYAFCLTAWYETKSRKVGKVGIVHLRDPPRIRVNMVFGTDKVIEDVFPTDLDFKQG